MSLPHSFDRMGTAAAGLPPGYERVESVLKPVDAYWQTALPTQSGYRFNFDCAINFVIPGADASIIADNLPPSGRRIYYAYFAVLDNRLYWQPSRYAIISLSNLSFVVGDRVNLSCEQADNYLTVAVGSQSATKTGLSPITKSGFFVLGAGKTSTGVISATTETRIWEVRVYRAETTQLLAHYVPFKKKVDGTYVYGLFDLVARQELPLGQGTIQP